jgi:hypothetical protein
MDGQSCGTHESTRPAPSWPAPPMMSAILVVIFGCERVLIKKLIEGDVKWEDALKLGLNFDPFFFLKKN